MKRIFLKEIQTINKHDKEIILTNNQEIKIKTT